jgi:arylsulfatase A-like enzyme
MKGPLKFSCLLCFVACLSAFAGKPHVLFIAIDDLRPDLGCYGNDEVKSPHIDQLAASGVVFERAYCQQSVCGPSRLSMMTSVYPDGLGIWGMSGRKIIEWRETRKGITSLPEQFRNHGYKALGFGKIYDFRLGLDLEYSWDAYESGWLGSYAPSDGSDTEKKSQNQVKVTDKHSGRPDVRPAVGAPDVADAELSDGNVAKLALEVIQAHDASEPLFLAVGFSKPHLPFVAPKKYWDLYDPEALTLAKQRNPPEGFSKYLFSWFKEIEMYDVPIPVPEGLERELVHGYYACVSYVDAQVGLLIQGLKDKGIYDDTLIVLWGDHGFKLGEFGEWAKSTNLEIDSRVPLIFSVPGARATGRKTESLVELLDIYPTLCELAGLPIPEHVEGRSLVPILNNPGRKVRDFALTQYPMVQGTMTYSVRTEDWRYHETREDTTGAFLHAELYNLSSYLVEKKDVLKEHPAVAETHRVLLEASLKSAKKWTGGDTISAW